MPRGDDGRRARLSLCARAYGGLWPRAPKPKERFGLIKDAREGDIDQRANFSRLWVPVGRTLSTLFRESRDLNFFIPLVPGARHRLPHLRRARLRPARALQPRARPRDRDSGTRFLSPLENPDRSHRPRRRARLRSRLYLTPAAWSRGCVAHLGRATTLRRPLPDVGHVRPNRLRARLSRVEHVRASSPRRSTLGPILAGRPRGARARRCRPAPRAQRPLRGAPRQKRVRVPFRPNLQAHGKVARRAGFPHRRHRRCL